MLHCDLSSNVKPTVFSICHNVKVDSITAFPGTIIYSNIHEQRYHRISTFSDQANNKIAYAPTFPGRKLMIGDVILKAIILKLATASTFWIEEKYTMELKITSRHSITEMFMKDGVRLCKFEQLIDDPLTDEQKSMAADYISRLTMHFEAPNQSSITLMDQTPMSSNHEEASFRLLMVSDLDRLTKLHLLKSTNTLARLQTIITFIWQQQKQQQQQQQQLKQCQSEQQ
jgi:hypothetical protein